MSLIRPRPIGRDPLSLGCLSCQHWRRQWCARELMVYPYGGPGRCDGFDYEPGSDEAVLDDEWYEA